MIKSRYDLAIGIDPGTKTGIAIAEPDPNASSYRWKELHTMPIHRALAMIQDMILEVEQDHYRSSVLIVVEDARQIGGPANQKMGAGSIRRDCAIWDDLLVDLAGETDALEFIFVKPSRKGLRKLTQEQLTTYTGCELKGSQHARDAVGVIFPHL